jgi:murein DD-endopeptidase MepM/ murein hydrolase activator NlpD
VGKQWPLVLDEARRPVGIMERALPSGVGGSTPIVLAALDTQPASATTSDSLGLAWAPAPQVPNPISKRHGAERRLPRADAGAIAVMPAPPPARDAITEIGLEPQRLFLPFAGEQLSASAERKLSHRAEPMWRARLPRSEPPARDPFAAIEMPKPVVTGPAFIMPFENGRISSLYNQGRRHPAIDLAGRMGSSVFSTSSNQTVTFAGWRGGYGNAVITRDKDGREHLYGHLSAIHVRPGKVLQQGERLGLLGSTGYSTGPHVHYEVKDKRGAHINPVTLLFPKGVRNGYAWAGTGLVRSEPTQTADARR